LLANRRTPMNKWIRFRFEVLVLNSQFVIWLKRSFPKDYNYRIIRTTIITRSVGGDWTQSPENYEVVACWEWRSKNFVNYLKNGGHGLTLLWHKEEGLGADFHCTYFSYEIQRRPTIALEANWKSLGYLPEYYN